MQKRLAAAERVLQLRKEQDQQLKDSIVMARREVGVHMSGMPQIYPRVDCGVGTPRNGCICVGPAPHAIHGGSEP